MDSRTYYYARVSSKDQNLDRQIAAFVALGATEREIITDKESGKNLDRAGYQALKIAIAREINATSTISNEITKDDSCYDIFKKRNDEGVLFGKRSPSSSPAKTFNHCFGGLFHLG